MTIAIIIYILFVIINIIICSICIYMDYNNGEGITLGNIFAVLGLIICSFFGTTFLLLSILDECSDIVVLKKKKKNKLK